MLVICSLIPRITILHYLLRSIVSIESGKDDDK
jgi:hypothetical protein